METTWFNEPAMMVLLKDYLDVTVFGVLGFMSFWMLAYGIERLVYFARVELAGFSDRPSLDVALTRHLTVIASIASIAPYIGLLGTVLGILITFHDLSSGTELSASAVMLGLALALKATAAGLFVAIPTALMYNALLRRIDVLTARWNTLRIGS